MPKTEERGGGDGLVLVVHDLEGRDLDLAVAGHPRDGGQGRDLPRDPLLGQAGAREVEGLVDHVLLFLLLVGHHPPGLEFEVACLVVAHGDLLLIAANGGGPGGERLALRRHHAVLGPEGREALGDGGLGVRGPLGGRHRHHPHDGGDDDEAGDDDDALPRGAAERRHRREPGGELGRLTADPGSEARAARRRLDVIGQLFFRAGGFGSRFEGFGLGHGSFSCKRIKESPAKPRTFLNSTGSVLSLLRLTQASKIGALRHRH